MTTVTYWGNARHIAATTDPDPGGGGGGGTPGTFEGSTAQGADATIAAMFGGEFDIKGARNVTATRSWINNPLPDNAVIDPNSTTAVNDFIRNVYDTATGTTAAEGGPSWGPVVAFPTINSTSYTSAINIIDHTTTPYKRVECIDATRRTASWHMQINAMMWDGIPLPDGIQPTNDSDGTMYLYDPNWVWPGAPTNQAYWGAIWEIWGAKSPEQHAAAGDGYTGWTGKSAGRMVGVNNRILGRITNRTTGDAASQASDTFGAPAAPWDPAAATGKIYWGFGTEGVAELNTMLASASHVAMSHHIITKRDVVNAKIRHPIGFALFPMYPSSAGSKGAVWPATGYDGASRTWLKHGNRIRFPAGSTPSYPAGMPTNLRPWFNMLFAAGRDYGFMLVDTTGNSFAFRAEPGIGALLPSGALASQMVKYLFQAVRDGTQTMQMITPGSDSNFYP